MKDRLCASADFQDSPLSRIATAGPRIAANALSDEVNGRIVFVRWPILLKII
jgi:hypothetical protein